VDRKDIRKSDVSDLLYYNALDAKYTTLLYSAQNDELTEQLKIGHSFLCRTATTIALMQKKGWELNVSKIKVFADNLDKRLEELKFDLDHCKEVLDFEKKYKAKYNHSSNDHIAALLYDILKLKPIKSTAGGKGKVGKPSTDHEVLKYYAELGVRPATLTLEYRETAKLKSTYIDPAESWVYKDGLVHTSYRHTSTRTGRLSSENPNMQNLPKKKGKWVRQLVKAPEGHWLLAVDYGQIEARCIAMASQDEIFCRNLYKGYDTHKEWAIKVIENFLKYEGKWKDWSSLRDIPENVLKEFRSIIKNGLVFPWFYGASKYSVATALGMSDRVMEETFGDFWSTFKGVKKWQDRLITFYNKHKYVETLTGQRRHGPMSKNELINCVDEKTLLLSTSGWKKYSEVKEGDLILTQNPSSLLLEWKPVQSVNIFPDYEGLTYTFKAKSFSACVTPNHRWLVRHRNGRKREWIYKFLETDKLSTWGDHGIPKIGRYVSYPTTSNWNDAEIELIGWILTDGCSEFISKKDSKHNHGNYDGYNWLITKVTAGDLPLRIRETLPDKILTMDFLLSLPKHQLEILLDSMMRGDGMFEGKKYKAFCSGTEQGARMFATLAFMCGYPVTINYRKLKAVTKKYSKIGNIPQGTEIWKVGFHNRNHFQTGWGKTDVKKEKKLMWCPTVENNTFVAMREGTIYITGNSPIQGTASHIVVDAGNRLSWIAYEEKKPHLQIILNVHDELVFCVPDELIEETIPFVAEKMCLVPFQFVGDIPIEVEVSLGPNWGEMEDICKYDSTMFTPY
jgi:DNA polymerase I-like protein with 3'-5' exonuclease and polymerase domains